MSFPIQDYFALVTSQYQTSPKFMNWLQSVLLILNDTSNCTDSMSEAFNVNNTGSNTPIQLAFEQGGDLLTEQAGALLSENPGIEGAQLDIIGQIVGQSRTMTFQPSDSVSPILDDTTYRTLLLAKIALNQWDGNMGSMAATWQTLFPGGTIAVQDNQDMTMNVYVTGAFTSILVDLINNGLIVPRPEGVLVNYYFGDAPYFGYNIENAYLDGYGVGYYQAI